jgi:Tol biopolymer transport system component
VTNTTKLYILSAMAIAAMHSYGQTGGATENLHLKQYRQLTMSEAQGIVGEDIDFKPIPVADTALTNDRSVYAVKSMTKSNGKRSGLKIVNPTAATEDIISDNIVESMAWSHAGKYLAFVQYEYNDRSAMSDPSRRPAYNEERLCVYNSETGQVTVLVQMHGCAIYYQWAPTKDYLAFSYVNNEKDKYELAIYDVEANQVRVVDEIILCDLWNFDWSPHSDAVIYTKPLAMDYMISEEMPIRSEIFIASADGKYQKQLTATEEVELFVKWIADTPRIVIEQVHHPEDGYDPVYFSAKVEKGGAR